MALREAVRLATFSVLENRLKELDLSIMAYATFSRIDESNMVRYQKCDASVEKCVLNQKSSQTRSARSLGQN